MSTSESSSSGVTVSLSNDHLWRKFYPINEMIVKGAGRKLFPDMEVKIEGLVPDVLYTVSFHLERVNNFKYLFIKNKKSGTGEWKKCSQVENDFPIEKKQHSNGSASGAQWMDSPVSFSQIYISSDKKLVKNPKIDPILVQTRHKYQPVITVERCDNGSEEEFRLTMTEFIIDTEYQNPKILELKKLNNKKASGFCPGGKHFEKAQKNIPRGTKRANDTNQTPPSTVASSNGTSVAPPTKKSAPAPIMTPSTMDTSPSIDSLPVGLSSGGFNTPNMTTSPTTTSRNMARSIGMQTDFQNPTPPPMPTTPSIEEFDNNHNETFTPSAMPMTPSTRPSDKENNNQMLTASTYKTPISGGPANFNDQRFTPPDMSMSRSSMATPLSATLAHMTPQSGYPDDFDNQVFTPPDMTMSSFAMATSSSRDSTSTASPLLSPLDMRAPQAHNSTMSQPYDFVKWCDSQLEDAPTLWDYDSHDSAQFGNE